MTMNFGGRFVNPSRDLIIHLYTEDTGDSYMNNGRGLLITVEERKVMAEKRLAIVVDATARMVPHWQTLLKIYIEPIIRFFFRPESTSQDQSNSERAVLGIVVHGAHDACAIQPSGWTRDMNMFLQWLSSLSFRGGCGGSNEAAVAQGLSLALMMFPSHTNGTKTEHFWRRHCLLVAASNPNSEPTSVILPKFHFTESAQIFESRSECSAHVETVAASFPHSFISLSVICPREVSSIRRIFNAGNWIDQGAESYVNEIKHPRYQVLLSVNFAEALSALAHQITGTETGPVHPLENFSEDEITMLQQIFPKTQAPSFPASTAQPNGLNSDGENLSSAQGHNEDDDFKLVVTPMGLVLSKQKQPLVPKQRLIPSQPNLCLTPNNTIKYGPTTGASTSPQRQSIHTWQMSTRQSSWSLAVNSNVLMQTPTRPQYPNNWNLNGGQTVTRASSFRVYEKLQITQRVEQLQARVSSRYESENRASRGCIYEAVQNEYSLKRKYFEEVGRANVPSADGAAYAMVGSRQIVQRGTESVAIAHSSTAETSGAGEEQRESCRPDVLTEDHERVWEGDINLTEEGQLVFVSRVVAYRKKPYSLESVINWPASLHIDELLTQTFLNNLPHEGDVEHIVLDITSYSSVFNLLKENMLCGYVNLNGRTMILTVNTQMPRFIGTLYAEVFPLYKHQIYRPKTNLNNHHQQQQQFLG